MAARMRQTLVEVLGEEKGTALYSMEWLEERVRFHLRPEAKVFLSEANGEITGHAIARLETGHGYFSTIFVAKGHRNAGLARALLERVEAWFRSQGVRKIVYNTAHDHERLIRLFERNGYSISLRQDQMVQLHKELNSKD